MACEVCATCRYYVAAGDGAGYCSLKGKTVRHGSSCCDYEED